MNRKKTKKVFGHEFLKSKRLAIFVAFFVFNFLKKKDIIIEIRRKKEKIKREVLILKINEKNQLKKIADNIAWISLFSDFLVNRNDVITRVDKKLIKMKNVQLYNIAYELLEMSGATKEDLEDFLSDVDLFE